MADQDKWIRLAIALILSASLHLMLIFFPTIHLLRSDRSEKGAQIVLQATIRTTKANARQAPTPPGETREAAGLARRDKSAAEGRSVVDAAAGKVASVEVAKTASGASPLADDSNAELAQDRTQAAASSERPEKASPGPESREAMAMQGANVPIYPSEAVRLGLESCVLAAVYVSPAGEVQAVRILHADVPDVFDQSVIDAHSAAQYLPARQHGQNVPSRVLAVVSFELEPNGSRNCAFKYAPAARKINALPASAEVGPAFVEEALRAAQ